MLKSVSKSVLQSILLAFLILSMLSNTLWQKIVYPRLLSHVDQKNVPFCFGYKGPISLFFFFFFFLLFHWWRSWFEVPKFACLDKLSDLFLCVFVFHFLIFFPAIYRAALRFYLYLDHAPTLVALVVHSVKMAYWAFHWLNLMGGFLEVVLRTHW